MMDVQNNGIKITDPAFSTDVELSNDTRKFFALKGEHKRSWTAENPNMHIGVCLKIDGALITTTHTSLSSIDCKLLNKEYFSIFSYILPFFRIPAVSTTTYF